MRGGLGYGGGKLTNSIMFQVPWGTLGWKVRAPRAVEAKWPDPSKREAEREVNTDIICFIREWKNYRNTKTPAFLHTTHLIMGLDEWGVERATALVPCLFTGEEDCCGRMLSVQGQRCRIPSIADHYACSTIVTTMEMVEPPSRFHSLGFSYNLRERKGPLQAKCDGDWTISST